MLRSCREVLILLLGMLYFFQEWLHLTINHTMSWKRHMNTWQTQPFLYRDNPISEATITFFNIFPFFQRYAPLTSKQSLIKERLETTCWKYACNSSQVGQPLFVQAVTFNWRPAVCNLTLPVISSRFNLMYKSMNKSFATVCHVASLPPGWA